ncbi:hypothetical protein A33M_1430 [Rhodovulum sp. PH10]|uniref:hypothetical protein n=1 Tax=Rhodovulum sp. PH10 TaxID=1187851 RepID=UPI00027C2AE8|nr:hypothetical protein [Rhodovulum sp. PH10]EJW12868.1 hypothetical protein A33M_1430 [Rhodovulum sp. PH10]
MSPIERVGTYAPIPRDAPHQRAADAAATSAADTRAVPPFGRALVPLEPARAPRAPRPVGRHDAGFLAHLIATKDGVPQTRDRRRAEPEEVQAAYGATVRATGPANYARIAVTA